jgi:hypothetical protein
MLRPLAVCVLIERQTNAADFSVDSSGVELLQFEVAALRMLTGKDPLPRYEKFDWDRQTQHVFRDNLRRAVLRLITEDDHGTPRVMDFANFIEKYPDPEADDALAPLVRLISSPDGRLSANPVFWVRLVGYAYVCNDFVSQHGAPLGFSSHPLDVAGLMSAVPDSEVRERAHHQASVFAAIAKEPIQLERTPD